MGAFQQFPKQTGDLCSEKCLEIQCEWRMSFAVGSIGVSGLSGTWEVEDKSLCSKG